MIQRLSNIELLHTMSH